MEHRSVLVVHERTTVHSPSLRRRDSSDLIWPRTARHRPTASSPSSQPSPPPASSSGSAVSLRRPARRRRRASFGWSTAGSGGSPARSAGRVPRRPQTLGHRCIIAFERGPGDPGSPGRAVELAPAGKRGVGVSAPARPAAPRRAVRGAREAASGRLRSGRGEPVQNRPPCWASAMLAETDDGGFERVRPSSGAGVTLSGPVRIAGGARPSAGSHWTSARAAPWQCPRTGADPCRPRSDAAGG
jgi:hypothetical protein